MVARLVAIVVVVAALAGIILYSQTRPEPNRVSGFIEADEIRLGSRVGGRVAKVHVEEGDQVSAGSVLVELEPFDLLEREKEAVLALAALDADYRRLVKGMRPEEVAQAKAHHDQLKAKLDLLIAGPRDQEIKAAQARVRAAEAELKLAEQLHKRHSALAKSNAIAAEDFERSRSALDNATASLAVRENELKLLELGARAEEKQAAIAAVEEAKQAWQMAASGYRQEEVEKSKAARDAAQAALEAVYRQREELVVKSPLDGVVDSLDLQPGDMVVASAPVLSLIDHRHLWVRAYVPQNRVGLQIGQELRVTVDRFPGRSFRGTVNFIARQAEFTPSNIQTPQEREKLVFRIKVDLQDHDDVLRPGMSADVWLDPPGDRQ